MRITTALVSVTLLVVIVPPSQADTFGSGANTFDIEFVSIGNRNNPADTTGNPNPGGKVEYFYRMGRYEISRDMITKANAVGGLGITLDPMGLIAGGPRDDMPATGVSWFEAARFVNWLNTSTGYTPAYKFDGSTFELWQLGDAGYNPANPFRNRKAFYFLPSADEWYKAAYYDPKAGVYYDYPTGSDTAPTAVASSTAAGTAVYDQPFSQGPADIMLAGGLSPYGTMGQGGNAWEWEDGKKGEEEGRALRGDSWQNPCVYCQSSDRADDLASQEQSDIGFRVASIPEPSSILLACASLILCLGRGATFQL